MSEQGNGPQLSRGVPLPVQIAHLFTERISSGQLLPGTRLPSEAELAQQFAVSRATIREATRLLVGEGLVETQRGRGTFVRREPHIWPVATGLEELISTKELIERAGYKPSTDLLDTRLTMPSDIVAAALHLSAGQRVHQMHRVRLADDVPVVLTIDFIPEALLSKHAATQLDRDSSLLGVLEAQAGERIALAVSHLHPIAATADLVRSLKVARRQPLLMLRETYYLESGNPVLYGEVFLNTELLSFHVRRRPLELAYSRTREPTTPPH